jgi:hypothetical protein
MDHMSGKDSLFDLVKVHATPPRKASTRSQMIEPITSAESASRTRVETRDLNEVFIGFGGTDHRFTRERMR